MTCHAAREELSALVRGGMDLTRRALVHAHVTQCPDCGKEREEYLQQEASSRQRVGPSLAVCLTWLRALPLIALSVSGQAARRVVEAARGGAARAIGLLTGVHWRLRMLLAGSVRAVASLIGRVRFVITRAARLVIWLHSSLMVASQRAARATIEAARAGVTRGLDLPMRLRVLVSITLSVSGQAARKVLEVAQAGLVQIIGLLTQVGRRVPMLLAPAVLLLSTALSVSGQAARRVLEVARDGVVRVIGLLTRLGRRVPPGA